MKTSLRSLALYLSIAAAAAILSDIILYAARLTGATALAKIWLRLAAATVAATATTLAILVLLAALHIIEED